MNAKTEQTMNMFELNANSPKKPSVTDDLHANMPAGQGIRRRAWPFSAALNTTRTETPVAGATWSCSGKKADNKTVTSDFVS